MKSIKPGRGPSFLGGTMCVAVIIVGIFWTIAAVSMGAPVFFPIFGIIFIGVGIVNAIYNFKNATGENRYSSFDITDDGEEPDPLNERFGRHTEQNHTEGGFCPYCGSKADSDFQFCRKCGRKLS